MSTLNNIDLYRMITLIHFEHKHEYDRDGPDLFVDIMIDCIN